MSQKPSTTHFPGLDELRFLAAAGIVVLHVEEFKAHHGYANWFAAALPLKMMVTFFFVLSGFLITYLLLAEREANRTVAVGRFYARRALRTWPLYLLIVLLGLLVLPHVVPLALPGLTEAVREQWGTKVALFLTLLPNVAVMVFPPVPYAAHAWSIGVEEQFYLTWPLLFRFARRLLPWMIGAIVVAGAARVVTGAIWPGGWANAFLATTRIGCMAIGGVGAYALFGQTRIVLALAFHRATQAIVAVLLGAIVFARVTIPAIDYEIQSILFCCVILNVAANPATMFRVRSAILARLGKWSYGVYMYHPIAIGLCIWILGRKFHVELGSVWGNLLIHGLSLSLTVAVASASYRFFETPFLRFKRYAERPTATSEASSSPSRLLRSA